ncbi:uncharacterized protein LTHEOB_6787 [Lasiodiplodia theobromae]|uniref:uncharacterized protein n=1 Tax=Lasiodiplodia theobromae TaxID=45133 RepID=UPI0015C3B052|nr:uncharacterized protein LTHEOB_6787 [Lasiodiplodia theobromae]KAF4543053.1 hypothetical protein LTHEOB_6787 [Lasiodiplodia theobromae]
MSSAPHRMDPSSADQTAVFAAVFVVRDAAQRWDKAVAFSGRCEISVDVATDSIIVQHKDRGWRITFPMASQVKRLVPCQSCRLDRVSRDGRLCDDGFPCSTCQQRGSRCIARSVLLSSTQAIDGEAEMEAAAEEASLVDRHHAHFAFSTWSFGAGPPNTYEGYLPLAVPQTPSCAIVVSSSSRILPATPPLLLKADSDVRRSNRLQEQKRRADDTPVPRPRLTAAQCVARMRKLAAARYLNSTSTVGYGLEPQHPPPTVDLGGLELTMAEISVFLLNLAHRPEGAMRIVNSAWTPHHFCSYHNYCRGLKGETRRRGQRSEGAVRSTITKSIQKTMRIITDEDDWLQTYHTPAPTHDLSTSSWARLADNPPDHSLRQMGSQIRHWPPEKHSLNLTRAVRFAVENPHIPDSQLRFPTHVRSIVERLPGGFRSRTDAADNLDQKILKDWKDFQEKQEL